VQTAGRSSKGPFLGHGDEVAQVAKPDRHGYRGYQRVDPVRLGRSGLASDGMPTTSVRH
jgi:hypothetical protein